MLRTRLVRTYERYHLSHVVVLLLLGLYTLFGAVCFCTLEGLSEKARWTRRVEAARLRSSIARDRLLFDLQYYLVGEVNVSRLLGDELQRTLDLYDNLMDFKRGGGGGVGEGKGGGGEEGAELDADGRSRYPQWDIWGGLYFSWTVYTTIGYGDIVTETVAGRLFTVLYALFGLPIFVTVLSIWGGGLFELIQVMWRKHIVKCVQRLRTALRGERRDGDGDLTVNGSAKPLLITSTGGGDRQEASMVNGNGSTSLRDGEDPMVIGAADHFAQQETALQQVEENSRPPITLALCLLVMWVFVCATVFSIFENWGFWQASYFFFISLSTVGLGDLVVEHKIACLYFVFILMGLCIVSTSFSVIQLQVEGVFSKLIRSIDNEFKRSLEAEKRKHSMSTNTCGERKVSTNAVTIRVPSSGAAAAQEEGGAPAEEDAAAIYSKELPLSERLLVRMLMSRHQHRLLNERMESRKNMRSVEVQTNIDRKSSSVQTHTKEERKASAAQTSAAALQEADDSSSTSESEEEGAGSDQAGGGAFERMSRMELQPGAATANKRLSPFSRSQSSPSPRTATNSSALGVGVGMGVGAKKPHKSKSARKRLYIYNCGD